MLRNITFSADNLLIIKARQKAAGQKKTLNSLFREWLKNYIGNANTGDDYDQFMEQVRYVNAGKKFSREELNAR